MKREIIVGVGALIVDNQNRVLLAKRHNKFKDFWTGKWIVPGGKLNYGESLHDAAIREVKEETNLIVEIVRHIYTGERILRRNGRPIMHVIYIDFLAKPIAGKVKPSSDVAQLKWFTRSMLKANINEIHVDTQDLLQKAGWL